jgi:hypothetical protein
MGDNTLPDQVGAMKELAQRYPFIDIDRAGIYGHSGGGFAAADAMFRYPDFFKVGISEAGNHDQRNYEDDWGERYQGLLVRGPDGSDNYNAEANQTQAANLKGKLLLAHGTMDDNVPPYNTLLVVNELIRANKDFDLLLLPNRAHGFGNEPYMVRRRWDYFVKNLLGAEPPKEWAQIEAESQDGKEGTGVFPCFMMLRRHRSHPCAKRIRGRRSSLTPTPSAAPILPTLLVGRVVLRPSRQGKSEGQQHHGYNAITYRVTKPGRGCRSISRCRSSSTVLCRTEPSSAPAATGTRSSSR